MSAVRAIRGAAVGPVRGAQRLLRAHKSWATQRIETTATGLGSFARILQGGVELQALCGSGAHRRTWAARVVRSMADGVTGRLESVSEEEKLTGGEEKDAVTGGEEKVADDELWRGMRTAGEAPELPVVLELVEEKKGIDVVVLDAREYTALGRLCQAMVVVTCTSRYVSSSEKKGVDVLGDFEGTSYSGDDFRRHDCYLLKQICENILVGHDVDCTRRYMPIE